MRGEEVVHDHEMDLATSRKLDTVKTVESGDEGVRVGLDVIMVALEDAQEVLVLGMVDSLDNIFVIAGKVEEGPRLSGATEFGENVFGGEREEVVGRVDMEVGFAEVTEDPGRIIFEFEVVFGGGGKFVSDNVETVLVFC